ncbi:MAG: arsenic resistance protein [Gemmatimonadaceae bacterium]
MDTITRLTGFVSRNLTKLIFVVMALGLLNTRLFGGIPFNIAICATASFLMIYPMFINLKIEDVAEVGHYKGVVATSVLLNFIVSPLVAFWLGRAFFADQPFMALGLMLIALLPTSGMTATWTELAKGELKAALSIIAVSLILIIGGLPFALPFAAGDELTVTPFFIFQRILLVIVIPLVLGDVTRRYIITRMGQPAYKQLKPVFSGLSSTGLLVVLFLIMSLDSNQLLLAEPLQAVRALVPLSMYYVSLFALSTLVGRLFTRRVGIALTYGTSVRYLALALGIAVPLLGSGRNSSQVVFVVALSFFIQVPLSSLYSRWIAGSVAA